MKRPYKVFDTKHIEQQIPNRIKEADEIIFLENSDDVLQVLRYFRWNTQKITSEWFNNIDKNRVLAGLDFDENLRKKYPEIDSALKENNDNTCPVFYCEFDENDPQLKPVSLKCGH